MAISSKQIGWSNESNLLWNIWKQLQWLTGVAKNSGGGSQGPQGNPGPQGEQGVQGEQGTTGAQGAALTILGSYPDLAAFLAGAGGLPGAAGDAWIILSDGSLYVWNTDTNLWNDVGDLLGPQGPQGQQGVQGEQGVQGQQGIQGTQGIQGETGSQGVKGDQGDTGAQGAAGNSVTILGSYADLAAFNAGAGSLPGANIGDSWILLSDGSLMTWNGSVWFDAGDIKGPQGDTGATGATGAKGDKGDTGAKGDQRIQGIQGIQGVKGDQGIQGVKGDTGAQGPAGLPGLFAQTASSTPIVTASGEASLIGSGVGTLSVPANAFQIGDSFVAKMCGILSCANNETIHIRIRSNGVVIIDAAVYTLSISNNKYWDLILDFTIRNIGGPGVGVLAANGSFTYNKNANSNIDGINFALISNTVFDTTVSNTLTITAEWITANAANTINSQNFTLTKVY